MCMFHVPYVPRERQRSACECLQLHCAIACLCDHRGAYPKSVWPALSNRRELPLKWMLECYQRPEVQEVSALRTHGNSRNCMKGNAVAILCIPPLVELLSELLCMPAMIASSLIAKRRALSIVTYRYASCAQVRVCHSLAYAPPLPFCIL